MLNRRLKSGSTNSTATSLSGCSVCLRLDDIIKKIKKLYPGRKRPHRFFIKRKPHRLTRVEKTPEPWPMPERAKPRGEHSEGVFLPQQPEIRF